VTPAVRLLAIGLGIAASILLILASYLSYLPASPLEAVAAVTGAWCVWLVVKQSPWNFPLGIITCGCYFVLFFQQRLFGDASLQIVFILLCLHGWYWWLHGGPGTAPLTVSRVPIREAMILAMLGVLTTLGLVVLLQWLRGSVPFLDALTTALSLVAQWMLNRKYLENWWVWIVADTLYLYLYFSQGLYLTMGLYALYMVLCIVGWIEWQRSLRRQGEMVKA
jgi:nicotinamide mononucleotide transporter